MTCSAALTRVGAAITPAEGHGVLCGMICSPRGADAAGWIADVLADADPEHPDLPDTGSVLLDCMRETVEAFEGGNFSFEPLLPDDEEPLAARSRALADWCAGFLHGLAAGGLDDETGLDADAREVLHDMSEFTRIDTDTADAEAGEADYAELVEYVRVGALLINESASSAREDPAAPPSGGRLH